MKPPVPVVDLPLANSLGALLVRLALDEPKSEPDAVASLVRETVASLVRAEAEGHACVVTPHAAALLSTGVVGHPGESKPLILDGTRIYLRRMFLCEGVVAQGLKARIAAPNAAVDPTAVGQFLRGCGLLPDAEVDWQAVAVTAGLVRPLVVISGGPGTGKTRTAAVLLAAIRNFQPDVKVALAAPTGKAAARLGEALAQTWAALPCGAGDGPTAMTLHRLLGASADGRRFRHGPTNPLPADLVLVDEASMVDLALMSRLVAALRPETRLVLLGDKDQLASVEAGYVLGDLCDAAGLNRFSPEFAALVQAVTEQALPAVDGGANTAIELKRNYRFGRDNAIQRLSSLVRAGQPEAALAALEQLQPTDAVQWQPLRTLTELEDSLQQVFAEKLRSRWPGAGPAEALAELGRFQILCALKRGPFGRDAVNEAIETQLKNCGLRAKGATWYPGRPVLITANAPHLGLFNGDLGVAWKDDSDLLQVWFHGPEGIRSFAPSRLPAHETAFALTVHKSQGSEFNEVLLVLPPNPSPVCTRELVYTGLTRARNRVTLWSPAHALSTALSSGCQRTSGLRARLTSAAH
jgi:exodeoxyribonuclease V alpha subunit